MEILKVKQSFLTQSAVYVRESFIYVLNTFSAFIFYFLTYLVTDVICYCPHSETTVASIHFVNHCPVSLLMKHFTYHQKHRVAFKEVQDF